MRESVRAFWAAWTALYFWAVNLPTLLRLTWFPLALLSLTGYAWHYWSTAAELALVETRGTPAAQSVFAPPMFQSEEGVLLWVTLQLIALSAAAVAAHRFVVTGERRNGEYFLFAFGNAERAYFAMGLAAYALMIALVAGQFLAQGELPALDLHLATRVTKLYAELGPWALSMLIFPGELPIFEMPPLNYALWSAIAIATGALVIRIAPWPAAVAAEGNFAIVQAITLTRSRALAVIAFFAAVAIAIAIAFAALAVAGLTSLAATGPDSLGRVLQAMTSAGTETAMVVQNVEIRSILHERKVGLFQEIARFVSGLIGVTLGATLISHLYLALSVGPPTR